MSRLLFAAARGARLEVMHDQMKNWELRPVGIALFWQHLGYMVRIHTDDEHLQYGPVSSALREFAEFEHDKLIPLGFPLFKFEFYAAEWLKYDACDDYLHRSLFLLILAEALADEGL